MTARKPTRHGPRRAVLMALTAAAMLAVGSAHAGTLYTWQDERGVTHISDERPPDGVDYETRPISASGGGGSGQPSADLRRQRCHDFKGALRQLRHADDLPEDRSAWQSAKDRAKRQIDQWCQ